MDMIFTSAAEKSPVFLLDDRSYAAYCILTVRVLNCSTRQCQYTYSVVHSFRLRTAVLQLPEVTFFYILHFFTFYYSSNSKLQTDGKGSMDDILSHINQARTTIAMPI